MENKLPYSTKTCSIPHKLPLENRKIRVSCFSSTMLSMGNCVIQEPGQQSPSKGISKSNSSNYASDSRIGNGKVMSAQKQTKSDRYCKWGIPPSLVLVALQANECDDLQIVIDFVQWVQTELSLSVVVTPCMHRIFTMTNSVTNESRVFTWASNDDWKANWQRHIDIIILFGTDRTISMLNFLFTEYMPPVLAFGIQTKGYLTIFNPACYKIITSKCLNGMLFVSSRRRLSGSIFRKSLVRKLQHADLLLIGKPESSEACTTFVATYEIKVIRGSLGFMTKVNCYLNGKKLTSIRGDGIVAATANSTDTVSMGGIILHPTNMDILLLPICPQSLSSRPMVLPENAMISIEFDTSNHAERMLVICDGKNVDILERGDVINIQCAEYPLPLVYQQNVEDEWINTLSNNLNWN